MLRRALPALVLLLSGCGSQPGTIAFTSTRDGNAEVYSMRADGSHLRDLTRNLAQDGQPAWSPDGTRIAFVSSRDGNAEIYVMRADGNGARRLTHSPDANDTAPVWSPDGRKLAFMCTTAIPRLVTGICVVDAAGGNERRLTTPSEGDNLYPQWSHNSEVILCTRSYGGYSVWELRADGGGESLFLAGGAEAAYSPDGAHVAALGRTPGDRRWSLYVGRRRISHAARTADSPTWSPQGDRLAFVSGGDVYVVDADGGSQHRLTHGVGTSLSPEWSADGAWMVFERLRGARSDVYVVRADGSGERNLTGGTGKNGGPVWQP
jgi:Tol biopolymer transport system component